MKCFIHPGKEALASCKTCGKGMCENCSAYSQHKGICPSCRKKEFENELGNLLNCNKSLKNSIIVRGVIAVILTIIIIIFSVIAKSPVFCIAFLIPIVVCISIRCRFDKIKASQPRIDFLTAEIEKLNKALQIGQAQI